MLFRYVVYKITFPNGKIYIGKDEGGQGHSVRYFGSWSDALIEQDFSKEDLQDLTLRKQILFESDNKLGSFVEFPVIFQAIAKLSLPQ